MIKQILGTTFSRILITLGGVAVLLLNTRYLGTEKLGKLSLLLISLHFVLQISELIGGPALVFFQKKYHTNKLLTIAYFWSLVVSVVSFPIINLFTEDLKLTLLISLPAFVQSINHSHLHLLVGKEKIKGYNLSTLLQLVVVVSLLLFFYLFKDAASVETYMIIYFVGQLVTLILTTNYLAFHLKEGGQFGFNKKVITDLFQYGFIIQLANIFQFGVYRLNYIILESFTSLSIVGIYSLGNQLSEKALIPGKAISLVQYSKISNNHDKTEAAKLTINLLTLSFCIGFLAAIALVLIPESLVALVFKTEFSAAQKILIYLAPGVLFMSVSTIYSHYFAGLGLYKFNTLTSFIGVIVIVGISYLLIPKYGMKGAAVATSVVYFIQSAAQFFLFKKESGLSWGELYSFHAKSFSHLNLNFILNRLR